ncbi:KIAA1919 [Cordylochernes scorpioides]|uniref:KIAA1919 n=1 Tax=Cordylochernes scorpioides TaxID=51811 RepID=A0ABY6KBB0_9ARAC|nr:KIAA1919 [Cordylochernes scorpioides]
MFVCPGGNVWCLDLWGKKSAPVMQALHFFFALGAFVAPLVAEPFLSPQIPVHPDLNHTLMRPQKVLNVGFNHGPPGPELGAHSIRRREANITSEEPFFMAANLSSLSNLTTTEAMLTRSTRKPKPKVLDGNQLSHDQNIWDRSSTWKKTPEKPAAPPASTSAPVDNSTLLDPSTPPPHLADNQTQVTPTGIHETTYIPELLPKTAENATKDGAQAIPSPSSNATLVSPSATEPPANSSSAETLPSQMSPVSPSSTLETSSTKLLEAPPTIPATISTLPPSTTIAAAASTTIAAATTPVTTTISVPSSTAAVSTVATAASTTAGTTTAATLTTAAVTTPVVSSSQAPTTQASRTWSMLPHDKTTQKPDYAPTQMTYKPRTTLAPSLKPLYINDNPPPMNEKENEESINEDAETTPAANMSVGQQNLTFQAKEKDFFTRVYEAMQHRRLGKFEFAYVILAVYLFMISIVFLVFLCLNPRESRSRQEDDLDKTHFFTSSFKISVVTLMSLFLCLYVGIQVAVGQLLKTFATQQVQLSKPTGYFLTYMFWGSFALSRSISVLLTIRFSAIRLLITDLVVCLAASIVLVAGAGRVEALLWVGIVVLALGMAPVFPLALSWIEHYIPVTNKIASLFILGEALGELAIPRVIERFINQEPMVLMYMNIVINLLCSVTFGALWLLASRQGPKYKAPPIRTLYQLANTTSDDLDFELSNHNNGDACSLLTKRRTTKGLSPA